jgi:hypothetical protein
MSSHILQRYVLPSSYLSLCITAAMLTPACALDTFRSIDNRLPNPDRPYAMTGNTVAFPSFPPFELYDLQFQPTNSSQLDIPTLNKDGNLEFDSSFDISYMAEISFGEGPAHPVSGYGAARAKGTAPAGTNPQVFDSELLALNLFGLSTNSGVMFRESPTLRSTGVTTREDLCPMCLSPVTYWKISSFFGVFAEVSMNGGNTWTPGGGAIHIEQVTTAAMDADFNHDGVVDGGDYPTWRKNNAGAYTSFDYDLWRANFGQSAASGLSASGAIPEPATCWLLTLAFCAVLQQRAGFITIAQIYWRG